MTPDYTKEYPTDRRHERQFGLSRLTTFINRPCGALKSPTERQFDGANRQIMSFDYSTNNAVKIGQNAPCHNPSDEPQTRHPLEYNGEKLDNGTFNGMPDGVPERVPATLVRGQYYDLDPDTVLKVYNLTEDVATVDLDDYGHFQLQNELLRWDDGDREIVARIAAYRRSDKLGEIVLTEQRATFKTDSNFAPSYELVLLFLQAFNFWAESSIQSDIAHAALPSDKEVEIGVSGVGALVTPDKLNLKLTEGYLPRVTWVDETAEFGPYTLHLQSSGGIGYSRKALVKFDGRQIGTLLWDATFPGLKETARYEIENAELYGSYNDGSFKKQIVTDFVRLLGSEVVEVARIDVAIDGPGVMPFLQRVHGREIMLVRQSAYNDMKKTVSVATDEIEGFSCGSRQSGRYFRTYNKSKEVRDGQKKKGQNYKSYITDWQSGNGLNLTVDIGRMEAELSARFLRTVEGFCWEDVLDKGKLVALFDTAAAKVFEWVPTMHSDSKINRRPRVEFLDFSKVKTTPYGRSYEKPVKSDRMEKIVTKRLLVEAAFVADDYDRQNLMNTANDMIDRHSLHGWLKDRQEGILLAVGDLIVERDENPANDWLTTFTETVEYCAARVAADDLAGKYALSESLRIALSLSTHSPTFPDELKTA